MWRSFSLFKPLIIYIWSFRTIWIHSYQICLSLATIVFVVVFNDHNNPAPSLWLIWSLKECVSADKRYRDLTLVQTKKWCYSGVSSSGPEPVLWCWKLALAQAQNQELKHIGGPSLTLLVSTINPLSLSLSNSCLEAVQTPGLMCLHLNRVCKSCQRSHRSVFVGMGSQCLLIPWCAQLCHHTPAWLHTGCAGFSSEGSAPPSALPAGRESCRASVSQHASFCSHVWCQWCFRFLLLCGFAWHEKPRDVAQNLQHFHR